VGLSSVMVKILPGLRCGLAARRWHVLTQAREVILAYECGAVVCCFCATQRVAFTGETALHSRCA